MILRVDVYMLWNTFFVLLNDSSRMLYYFQSLTDILIDLGDTEVNMQRMTFIWKISEYSVVPLMVIDNHFWINKDR